MTAIEEKAMDKALKQLQIDFKLKAEILKQVVSFTNENPNPKAKGYEKKAKECMIVCNKLIRDAISENEKLDEALSD